MNKSTFWMIKYMNGSVCSKARYMNGIGFEILAHTPVPKLPLLPPPSPPPTPENYGTVIVFIGNMLSWWIFFFLILYDEIVAHISIISPNI